MGKIAETEKIKLKAAFYNNIGVSFGVLGLAAPAISFFARVETSRPLLQRFLLLQLSADEWGSAVDVLLITALAFVCALIFHHHARDVLEKLED
jgi:hypothetical protein